MTYIKYYDSPLGRMLMAADGAALTGLWFEGQKHFARTLTERRADGDLPVFAETATTAQIANKMTPVPRLIFIAKATSWRVNSPIFSRLPCRVLYCSITLIINQHRILLNNIFMSCAAHSHFSEKNLSPFYEKNAVALRFAS